MRNLRHTATTLVCTAIILSGAAIAAAQMRGPGMMGGGAGAFRGIFSPVVGEGAEYQMTSANDPTPTTMGIAVVGKEDVNGVTGYWMEITTTDRRSGGTMYMKMLTVISAGNMQTTKMIMQQPGQQPMEMDMSMMQGMQGRRPPQPADISKQAQDMGSETVTVPAGTFTCEHYKTAEGDEVWVSSKVSPWGLVKMTGAHANMTLMRVITDAKDMITGTPVQMQMPNMGGMGGPPHQ
jgi:hypothetical protein